MIVVPEPLLDGFNLNCADRGGSAKPKEVTFGAWEGEDLLALVIFYEDEDVAAK